MTTYVVVLIAWFICGFVSYGLALGSNQSSSWLDRLFIGGTSFLGGPAALIATLLIYGIRHWKL